MPDVPNESLVLSSSLGCCFMLFFLAGGIGLGIGWIFFSFLQGLGIGILAAFGVPMLSFPVLHCVFNACERHTNGH